MDRMRIDLALLTVEPAEAYHAKGREFVGSHRLIDFIRCPLLFHQKAVGIIPDADSESYLLGRAAHVRILEGITAYEAAFAVGGPVNPKTQRPYGTETKAFAEWAAAQGKSGLSCDQAELVSRMAGGVDRNQSARALLEHGVAERVARANYCSVPCQARFDWINPDRGIVDLKTCDDLSYFEADARRFSYHRQMAFYQAVLALVIDGLLVPVHIIAVEKKEPFRCGAWLVSDDTLAIARQENEAALRRLIRCRDTGHWPTGYEEVRVFDVI